MAVKIDVIDTRCEKCGEKFARSKFNPYMKFCNRCRGTKIRKKISPKITVNEEEINNINFGNGKEFQYLPEWGIKVHSCCFAMIKKIVFDKTKRVSAFFCPKCTTQFNKVDEKHISIGYGLYKVTDQKLVLVEDYRSVPSS